MNEEKKLTSLDFATKVKSFTRAFEIPEEVIDKLPLPDEIKEKLREMYRISERSNSAWLLISKSEGELLENLGKIETEQAKLLVDQCFDTVTSLAKVDNFHELFAQAAESTKKTLDAVSRGSGRLQEEVNKQYQLAGYAGRKFFDAVESFLGVLGPK